MGKWLRHPGTVDYSFGNLSTTAVSGQTPGAQASIYEIDPGTGQIDTDKEFDRIANPDGPTGADYQISNLVHFVRGPPARISRLLDQGTAIDGVSLIGPPAPNYPGGIRSLDGAGWVYIRRMWLENFQLDDPGTPELTEPNRTRDETTGSADLQVVIWQFTNRIDKPSLDCVTESNCVRKLLTFPLRLTLTADLSGVVDTGSYGIQCDIIQRFIANPAPAPGCNIARGEFFRRIYYWDNLKDDDDDMTNGNIVQKGQCCRYLD